MHRLKNLDLEHQDGVESRRSPFRAVSARHGRFKRRAKQLEIHDRLHPFEIVAIGQKLSQT